MAVNGSERRTTRCKPPALAAETRPSEGPRSVSAASRGPRAQRANNGLEWPDVRRDINSGILDLAEKWRAQDEVFSFLCECGDPQCSEAVPLLPRVYTAARARNEVVVARAHAARPAKRTVAQR
jgi:hypothetical protein